MAAASFRNKVVVFGGTHKRVMYEFDEEGGLVKDLSSDPLIPECMDSRAYLSERGNIYVYELVRVSEKWEWMPQVFDGEKWTLL